MGVEVLEKVRAGLKPAPTGEGRKESDKVCGD